MLHSWLHTNAYLRPKSAGPEVWVRAVWCSLTAETSEVVLVNTGTGAEFRSTVAEVTQRYNPSGVRSAPPQPARQKTVTLN